MFNFTVGKKFDYSVIDFYYINFILYAFLHPLVKLFVSENGLKVSILIALVSMLIAGLVTVYFSKCMFSTFSFLKPIRRNLLLSAYLEPFYRLPKYIFVLGILFIFGYLFYGLFEYHMLWIFDQRELSGRGAYWFLAIHTLFKPIVIFLSFFCFVRFWQSRSVERFFWFIGLMLIVLSAFGEGRRFICLFLMVNFLVFIYVRQIPIFHKKTVMLSGFSVLLLFAYSQIYQDIRPVLQSPGPSVIVSLVERHDFTKVYEYFLHHRYQHGTYENIQERPDVVELLKLAIAKQSMQNKFNLTLLNSAFFCAVPKVISPDKPKNCGSPDILLSELYNIPKFDYSDSLYGFSYFMVGPLMFLLVPILMGFLFVYGGLAQYFLRSEPLFAALNSAVILQYLSAIESSFIDYFVVIRNIMFIVFLAAVWKVLLKSMVLRVKESVFPVH